MSLITRFLPNLFNTTSKFPSKLTQTSSNFHSLTTAVLKGPQELSPINPGGLFTQATRTNIRCHFPKPSEAKRVKTHGWKTRMSTPSGRRILMNRILKGRWVYSH